MGDPTGSTTMLFCPPHPPFRMWTEGPFSIGRTGDCDFTIPQADISRRHAEIRRDGEQWLVRDLGSTNGTFVNGARIAAECALSPGDRIELGAATVTFCRVDGALDGAPDGLEGGATMVFERTAPGEAFKGDLAEIPPFALFQVLEMGAKSGILEIRSSDASGRIWFRQGLPVHAETEKDQGFDAAAALVNAEAGTFHFGADASGDLDAIEATIQCSVTQLLLEASKRLDEANR